MSEKRGYGTVQLDALGVGWFYSWGPTTGVVDARVPFVPMIFRGATLASNVGQTGFLLGFNEPDNENQANMKVDEALRLWPALVAKVPGALIGSPAMAGNPATGDWLPAFMAAQPQVDFVTVHWYKGPDAKKFQSDLQAVYDAYKKPIWVTEFAPQTTSSSKDAPNKFTQQQVNSFIDAVVPWMEQTTWIHRYAWHDSGIIGSSSCLYTASGALSATGQKYAA